MPTGLTAGELGVRLRERGVRLRERSDPNAAVADRALGKRTKWIMV